MEETDPNHNVETKTPEESGVHASKNAHECAGCIQKAVEIEEWESKYNEESEQRKQLKKVYMNLNVEFTELYMKYQSLLKIVKGTESHGDTTVVKTTDCRIVHSEAPGAKSTDCRTVHGDASDGGTSSKDNEATGGDEKDGDNIFTDAQIKFLQFMPLDKKSDCTFILQCLKYAYGSDTSVLASRTLKGTSKRTEINSEGIKTHYEGKAPLSPIKVDRIKRLFMERISKCDIHSAEYVERIKDPYVHKLFAAGIGNLSKNNK